MSLRMKYLYITLIGLISILNVSYGQDIEDRWVLENNTSVVWEFKSGKVYFNRSTNTAIIAEQDGSAQVGDYTLSETVPSGCSAMSNESNMEYIKIVKSIDETQFVDCYYVYALTDKFLNIQDSSSGKSMIFKRE